MQEMTMPLISVIIPVYNCAEYLPKALASVLDQNNVTVEVIVVDSSTDNSCATFSSQSESRVRYVYQEPRGVSAARNLGIQHAHGEYIAFQDADDEWLSEKLLAQMAALQRYPDAGLVFTDTMAFSDGGVVQDAMSRHILRDWCQANATQVPGCYVGDTYAQLLMRNFMNTSSVMVRRTVLEQSGSFDESFKVGEDYDLWLRIARSHRMIFLDRVYCKYRVRDDGLSGGEDIRGLRWRDAQIAVREKHRQLNWIPAEYVGVLNQVLGQRCWEAGWDYFGRNQMLEARRYFWIALRAQPLGLKTWLYWFSSFLPEQVVEAVRSIRHADKKKPIDEPHARQ
jgi:glycosyltransferase involved in cell wall biosynthesis